MIGKKCALIQKYWDQHDRKAYTVEVHALKSASRQIGAMRLADAAERLEAAGNAGDDALIDAQTGALLEKYRSYQDILAPWCAEQEKKGHSDKLVSGDELRQALDAMQEAVGELDMDAMEQKARRIAIQKPEISYISLHKRWKSATNTTENPPNHLDTACKSRYNT